MQPILIFVITGQEYGTRMQYLNRRYHAEVSVRLSAVGTGSEVSRYRNVPVPKCLGAEMSRCRSVRKAFLLVIGTHDE